MLAVVSPVILESTTIAVTATPPTLTPVVDPSAVEMVVAWMRTGPLPVDTEESSPTRASVARLMSLEERAPAPETPPTAITVTVGVARLVAVARMSTAFASIVDAPVAAARVAPPMVAFATSADTARDPTAAAVVFGRTVAVELLLTRTS